MGGVKLWPGVFRVFGYFVFDVSLPMAEMFFSCSLLNEIVEFQ